jgi:NAD(P)-dependent dehydrogenase (short-subunit alcohol dehydrogenase family)
MKVNDAVVLAGASGGLGRAISEALFKAGGRRVFARLSGQTLWRAAARPPWPLPLSGGQSTAADRGEDLDTITLL